MINWLEKCIVYNYLLCPQEEKSRCDADFEAIMASHFFSDESKKRMKDMVFGGGAGNPPNFMRYSMIEFEDMFWDALLTHIDSSVPNACREALEIERILLSEVSLFPNDIKPLLYNMWEDADDF